jgi:uncharacterized C2H2 Zn-finger protein
MFPPAQGIEARENGGMEVLQCPECDLKFRFSSELEEHLALEHPDFEAKAQGRDEDSMSAARRNRQIRSDREGR